MKSRARQVMAVSGMRLTEPSPDAELKSRLLTVTPEASVPFGTIVRKLITENLR